MITRPTQNPEIGQYQNATFSIKGSYVQTDGTLYDFSAYSAGAEMNDATKGLVQIYAYDSTGTPVSGYPQYALRYASDSHYFILNVAAGLATVGAYDYKVWVLFSGDTPRLCTVQRVQILSIVGSALPS